MNTSQSDRAALAGKVFLVTGGGSGIGRSIAIACAAAAAQVAIADVSSDAADETRALLDDAARAMTIRADVSSEADVIAMVRQTLQRFGRIDGVVANVGVFGRPFTALDTPLDAWESALRINLTGAFLTLRETARALVQQGGGGSLLAIGSALGIRPIGGNLAYSTSKAGVHALVRAMALELAAHRIRVNAIVPGVTVTPATTSIPGYLEQVSNNLPLRSPAQPEEVAKLAVLLLSDALPHMTGSLLPLDSGVTSA